MLLQEVLDELYPTRNALENSKSTGTAKAMGARTLTHALSTAPLSLCTSLVVYVVTLSIVIRCSLQSLTSTFVLFACRVKMANIREIKNAFSDFECHDDAVWDSAVGLAVQLGLEPTELEEKYELFAMNKYVRSSFGDPLVLTVCT